jgi:WD40 repeat protein
MMSSCSSFEKEQHVNYIARAVFALLVLPNVAYSQMNKEPALDRFGDPLPPNALARLGTVRFRDASMSHVKFSPDGTMLATYGHRNVVSLWDANTGRMLREIGKNDSPVIAASFTPDGKHLVSGGYDGRIQFHNPNTGELMRSFQAAHTYSLAISSDGKRVVTKAGQNQFKVWNVETGEAIVSKDSSYPDQFEFSPDGKVLCIWNTFGVEIWDTERWQLLKKVPGYHRSGKFTRDPNLVLYVSEKHVMTLWDIKAEKAVHQFKQDHFFYGIDVHPTESIAVSGSPYGFFAVWDLKNGQLIKKCQTNMFYVWEPSFTRDGKRIAVCSNGGVEVWDTAKWEPVLRFDVPASPPDIIAITENGKELVSLHNYSPHFQISRWDVAGT